MDRLPRRVTISTSSSPALTASSTTYWIAGVSMTGSISFGVALVAGRNRVPRPAAGMTALVTAALAMLRTLARCGGLVHGMAPSSREPAADGIGNRHAVK